MVSETNSLSHQSFTSICTVNLVKEKYNARPLLANQMQITQNVIFFSSLGRDQRLEAWFLSISATNDRLGKTSLSEHSSRLF